MVLAAIDIGLSGGIAIITPQGINVQRMPVKQILDKPAVTIFARDTSGNKILLKSGPNKGTYRKVIKTAAKTHKELDCYAIYELLHQADELIIESPAMSFGNSAKSTASTNRNYGKLLAIADLADCTIIPVPPHVWKKALDLGRDKSVAISFAEQLLSKSQLPSNQSTFTATQDGLAEAICIAYHHNKEILCLS